MSEIEDLEVAGIMKTFSAVPGVCDGDFSKMMVVIAVEVAEEMLRMYCKLWIVACLLSECNSRRFGNHKWL